MASGGSGTAGGSPGAGQSPAPITQPRVVIQKPYLGQLWDPEKEREETRKKLALLLAAVVVLVSLLLVTLTATNSLSITEAKELAGFVLSPLIGVTGTALGFYFGGHHAGGSSKRKS